jgi:hypothetical protein
VYQFSEMRCKPGTGYRARAEGGEVLGLLLTVDEGYSLPL